jgi:hypothetical protein
MLEVIVPVLVGSTLAGCGAGVDLSAAQKFSQAATDAKSSFAAIAADFQGSCLRRRDVSLIQPGTFANGPLAASLKDPRLQEASGLEPTPVSTAFPSPPPVAPSYVDDVQCDHASDISNQWSHANDILLEYPEELGAIADVDAVPTPNLSPLGSALVSAGFMKEPEADAIGKLDQDIGSFVIEGEQRRQIHDLVVKVDPSIQVAIPALKSVSANYSFLLGREYTETVGSYAVLIGQEVQSVEATPKTPNFVLENQIEAQRAYELMLLQDINARQKAAVAYVGVLDDLAKTQKELMNASETPTLKSYVTVFNKSVPALYGDVETLKKAAK